MNTTSPQTLYRTLIHAAGAQAATLKRCLLLAALAAILQGIAYAALIPLFAALAAQHSAYQALTVITILLTAAALARWYAQDYDYNGYCALAGDAMRRTLGDKLRCLPLQTLYRRRSGEINALLAGTVDDVYNYTLTVSLMLINAVLTPIATGLGVLLYDPLLGLILLLTFPLILPIYHYSRPLLDHGKTRQAQDNSALSAELLEYTQGLPALKAANSDSSPRLHHAIRHVENTQRHTLRGETLPNLILGSGVESAMLILLYIGMIRAGQGSTSAWLLAALAVACIRFAEPLAGLLSMMSVYHMVEDGYRRLRQLLAAAELPTPAQPAAPPDEHDIRLENINFTYDDSPTPALHNLSLHIPARAMTAIVGGSGSGKTTLARLIMRHADPQQGRITIGGCDIRDLAPAQLAQYISVVFQDVYLFDDSISANLRLGKPDASDAELIAAAQAAQAHDFITALPQGYATRVGEIGGKLSGGERQRISIARALLKNTPIIILDEPTAALDTLSEAAVQQALDSLVRDKTVLIITHRLPAIIHAEQILVMDNGHLAESGRHDELLARNGRYAALWHAGRREADAE